MRRVVLAVLTAGTVLLVTAPAAPAVTWRRAAAGTAEDISAVDYRSPAQLLFTTTAGSIFARAPNGSFARQAAFPGRQLSDIAFRPAGDVGLATADSGHLFRFANGVWTPVSLAGATWNHDCPDLPEPPYARVAPVDNLVAVAWSSETVAWVMGASAGEVLESVDAGATWTDVSRLADGTCRLDARLADVAPVPGGDTYFLDVDATLWRAVDGFATAPGRVRDMPICSVGDLVRLAIDPASPNRLAAISACDGEWGFSRDSGTTAQLNTPSHTVPLRAVAAGPGVFLAAGDRGKIERTFDGVAYDDIPARGALAREAWTSVDLADREHAAVGGRNGVLVLSADVGPRPALLLRGGVQATRAGRRVIVRARGRLRPPRGIPAAACPGRVRVTVARGRRQLAARSARVRPSCRFATTIRLPIRRVGRARRLTVRVRFGGNPQLDARRKTVHVSVRR
jgi:hypothetical protein